MCLPRAHAAELSAPIAMVGQLALGREEGGEGREKGGGGGKVGKGEVERRGTEEEIGVRGQGQCGPA